jgi:UDP-N-acetylglucosamine--N-acetylmuramyl-(pentapeptide) pyrophosphoryl-undecaprenol N-acetylglucosamine transferase
MSAFEDSEVLYIGTPEGMENAIVPQFGIHMERVEAKGWQQRRRLSGTVPVMRALGRGYRQAARILDRYKPQVVVGTGGYVCVPVALAAARRRIPVLLHEQNAYPGLANRMLSVAAVKIMLTFPEAVRFFPRAARGKAVWTGMPVRREFLTVSRAAGMKALGLDPNKRTLLAVGGSQGAQSLNRAMIHVIKQWAGDSRVQAVHVTGVRDYENVMRILSQGGISAEENVNIKIMPYLDHMEYALACADLCVTRASAGFLSEMALSGTPGILIPYPYAASDHQSYNARSMEKSGAAVVLADQSLTGPKLLALIEEIFANEDRRRWMAENSRKSVKENGAKNVLKLIEQMT